MYAFSVTIIDFMEHIFNDNLPVLEKVGAETMHFLGN